MGAAVPMASPYDLKCETEREFQKQEEHGRDSREALSLQRHYPNLKGRNCALFCGLCNKIMQINAYFTLHFYLPFIWLLNYSREPENICICESPKVNPVKFYVKIFCLFKIRLALKFEPCVDSIMLICIALGCFKVPTFFCWMHPKNPELKSTAEFNNSNDSGRSIISCKTNIFWGKAGTLFRFYL